MLGTEDMSWQEAVDFCAIHNGQLWWPEYELDSEALFDLVQEIQEVNGEYCSPYNSVADIILEHNTAEYICKTIELN